VHDEGEVLAKRGEGDDVLVDDALGQELEQRLEVELEGPPLPFEQRRVELADPAALNPSCFARVKERLRGALEARLHLEGGEERLDGAPGDGEAALGDRGYVAPLLRQLLADGKVDTRDLEESDLLVPHVDVVARRGDEAVQERRAENRVLGGERVGEA